MLDAGLVVLDPLLPELVPDELGLAPELMPELAPLLVPLLPELVSDVLGLAPGPVLLLPAALLPLLDPLLPGGTLDGDDGEE